MKLVSDFHQWYDYIFDGQGPTFERLMFPKVPMGKERQLQEILNRGWEAPMWIEKTRVTQPPWFFPLVVYTDPNAHCGEGKVLVERYSEWRLLPHLHGLPAVAFFEESYGVSWRRLQIGRTVLWLEYRSTDDWRSNCGQSSCTLIGREKAERDLKYPMHAIDFALGDELHGIDFNTAPGIPLGVISASEILEELQTSE